MEIPYAVEGIILSSDRYREKDRLLTIYTRELGKIRVISRGSRKMNSKLSPHIEPLTWVNLMLVNGKTLVTLTGAAEIKSFPNLKSKGAYVLLALYLAELINKATLENLPDEKIFYLFLDLLRYLNSSKPKLAMAEIILIFKLKLLEFLGFRPAEVSAMPLSVLKIIRLNFYNLEGRGAGISWSKASKQKLETILNNSLAEILSSPSVVFDEYIRFFKTGKSGIINNSYKIHPVK